MDSEVKRLYEGELFHVRRSVKYHDQRKRFFENALNVAVFLALASGPMFMALGIGVDSAAGTEGTKNGSNFWKYVPGMITSVFAGMVLVSKAGAKANLHDRIKERFIELRQDMELAADTLTKQDVAKFTARRLGIEINEPPINRVVDAMSHNAVCQSMGEQRPTAYVKIKWRHRILGHFTRSFDSSLALYTKDDKGPGWLPRAAD